MAVLTFDATKIIQEDNPDILIQEAEQIGARLAGAKLANSQLRNIYSTVKQVQTTGRFAEAANKRKIKLLIPKLQYLSAREPKLTELSQVLTACIRAVSDETHFTRFAEFFEAIVAYHYAVSKERASGAPQSRRTN